MGDTVIVKSLHVGAEGVLEKASCDEITVEVDGIVGDRHRGYMRECWEGDKQPEGTQRRNERQWSAISTEELALVSEAMGLETPLQAGTVGVNMSLSGLPELSRLPRGTSLTFPSGAVLMVEEYNPPCSDMGKKIAALHRSRSGDPLATGDFSKAAKFSRGVVGIVEVPGVIRVGDTVEVAEEVLPKWLRG